MKKDSLRPKTKHEIIRLAQVFLCSIKEDILVFDYDSIKNKITEFEWMLEEEK